LDGDLFEDVFVDTQGRRRSTTEERAYAHERPPVDLWSHEAEAIIAGVRWEGGRVSALIAFVACTAIACSKEEVTTPNEACEPSLPPEVPTEVPGEVRGSITVLDRSDFTLDDQGKPRSDIQGRIAATFADFSAVTSTKSGLMLLGDTCVGTISRP